MSKLIITRGLPASGKTTWASQWVLEDPETRARVNRDSMRAMLHIDKQNSTHRTEVAITKACTDLARAFLRDGVDVVVDDTNLRQRNARQWATLAAVVGADFEVQDFTGVPFTTCLQRNAARPTSDRVPSAVIEKMHAQFLASGPLTDPAADTPVTDEWFPLLRRPDLEPVILVDIDGTVAKCGDRDIYDGSKAHLDTPHRDVIETVKALAFEKSAAIIFMTGRSADYRDVTVEWLAKHFSDYTHGLLMRPSGDNRRDDVVKHELFNNHIRHAYNPIAVFDDRNQVVDMWRAIGLRCYQVAPGNF